MRTIQVRNNLVVRTIISFGASQGIGFAAAVIRIPVLIHSLGVTGFAQLSLVVAALQWFCLPGGSTQAAARVLAAEHADDASDHIFALWEGALRPTVLVGRAGFFVGTLGAVLGSRPILTEGGSADFVLAISACAIAMATATRGFLRLGLLEAEGRTATVNVAISLATLASLLTTLVAAANHAWLWVFALCSAIAVFGPAWLTTVPHFRPVRNPQRHHRYQSLAHQDVKIGSALTWRLAKTTAIQQIQNGLDPFTISWRLGDRAVSEYSIVMRIASVLTVVPVALQPVFVRQFGAERRAATASDLRSAQLRMSATLAATTGALSVLFVISAPVIVRLLTDGAVDPPRMLFVAVAVLDTVFAWQVPVLASLSGAAGTRFLARWFPVLAATNLVLSLMLVRHGVWVPTAVSCVLLAAGHVSLFGITRKRDDLLTAMHSRVGPGITTPMNEQTN